MNKIHNILLIFLMISGFSAAAQEDKVLVKKGNKAFENQQYSLADSLYNMALKLNPNSVAAQFNSADALFQQKKYAEAAE